MNLQRSPLKARNINLNENSIRKQLGKKQLKRKSSLFGTTNSENPSKRRICDEMYEDSLDSSFCDSFSQSESFYNWPTKKSTSPPMKKKYFDALPVDLRLATKIRIISKRPFPFSDTSNNNSSSSCVNFDSSVVDESCQLLTRTDFSNVQQSTFKGTCPLAILKSAGLYYQYPDIPYMQMFPRRDGIARSKGIRASLTSFGSEVVDTIRSEWLKSFDHLYNSWKNGKKVSFYLCAPLFTILFIKIRKEAADDTVFDSEDACTGLNDFWEHKVVVTPTECGLREKLKSKGIHFVQPLMSGEEIEQENWMRKICFSPSKIKMSTSDSLDQFALEDTENSMSRGSAASESESTIVIAQLNEIDTFRDLLIESNLGWAKSGQQSGLPPTILSADQFMNSALKSLKFKTQVLRKNEGTEYTLDIEDGPILPHVSQVLHEFLRSCSNQLGENDLRIHVNGRSNYDGLNEASSAETYKNLNEFNFDGSQFSCFH